MGDPGHGWLSTLQAALECCLSTARLTRVTPRLAAVPGQIRKLLDALCAFNLLLFYASTFIADFSGWDRSDIVIGLTTRSLFGLLLVGLWLAVRRRGQRAWVLAFYVIALVATGMDEFSMLFMAIVSAYVYVGRRTGHILSAVAVLAYIAMFWLVPKPWTLQETALIVWRFLAAVAIPALIGYVLRRHRESLAHLGAINSELGRANADIRARASLDEDLLLAEERARAARELHDGLGQQLTVAGMSLDFASRSWAHHPEAARTEVSAARETLGEALDQIRSWAQTSQRAAQHSVGLPGLVQLAKDFESSGLAVDLELPRSTPELSRRQALFVTRFAQEGLTNALKHGGAARVQLRASTFADRLVLVVSNPTTTPTRVEEGFGLRSLRERAAELDGEFGAQVVDGVFTMHAELPLEPAKLVVSVG